MITLRPSSDFAANGALRGGIIAYDDLGEPLWESRGNWSDRRFLTQQAKDLAEGVGITEENAWRLLSTAVREARKIGDSIERQRAAPTTSATGLPIVTVNGRQLRDISDDGWGLIRDEEVGEHRLYALGGAVVDLVRRDGKVRPRPLLKEGLRWHLARKADWQKEGQDGPYPVAPPREVMEDMLAHPAPPLLPLTGFAYAPIVTPSGEILSQSGYHPDHGYYIDLGDLHVPAVPAQPTAEEVANARRLLLDELLIDFRFAEAADRTHAVEALLAPILRPAINGPTPLRMIEAPTPGSGKGLLAVCIGMLITGSSPRSMTEGHDDDEWRRRITAAVLDAQPITLLDNVRRRLESGSFASVLTAVEWSDRVLGASRIVTVPVRTTWIATANNPSYSEELARRVIRIRLDTGVERPWERSDFRHNPLLGWVRQDRDLLLWALLVIISAWIAEGRPRGNYVMGSYEEWAAIAGGILDVAGLPGFLSNREATYQQAETDLAAWRELVGAWWGSYRGQRIGIDKLFDLARDHKMLMELRTGRSDRGARTAMGMWLASMTDRVVAGYRIRKAGEARTGGLEYELQPAQEQAGDENSAPRPSSGNAKVPRGSATDQATQAELNLERAAEPFRNAAEPLDTAHIKNPAETRNRGTLQNLSVTSAQSPPDFSHPLSAGPQRFREVPRPSDREAAYNDAGELVDAVTGEPLDPDEWAAGRA